MNVSGYLRIRAYVPSVRICDITHNLLQIEKALENASTDLVDCLVFPELCITGYTCGDLFQQELLLEEAEKAISSLLKRQGSDEILYAVGSPVRAFGKIFNCAVVIAGSRILGIVPKIHIPNYGEFYEKRWFDSGKDYRNTSINFCGCTLPFGTDLIFEHKGSKIGIEICEDLWVPRPPSSALTQAGAEIILNLSASDELIGKHDYLINLISQQSARCRCVYAYASAGWGESSTDLVFSGKALIAEDGKIYGSEKRFNTAIVYETIDADIEKLRHDRTRFNTFFESGPAPEDFRIISSGVKNCKKGNLIPDLVKPDPYPFVPQNPATLNERCEEIFNIQSYGLMRRMEAIGCSKVIVGISGGLDSTLALLVSVKAFDTLGLPRKGIIGVTMPGAATTKRTKNNAGKLMKELGITSFEIPISDAVEVHFKDIQHLPDLYDATYENSQARERTQILMDLANKYNGIVVGTGDMSELALGWCTYNGDHMSMYGVNASVPKTLVKHLVKWIATNSDPNITSILEDIVETPISPELIPSGNDSITQKTEDLVGPYELHDFFLFNFLRNSFSPLKIYMLACRAFEEKYEKPIILKWLKVFVRRFFTQQFKRSCMPDGPKVGSVNLSPRGDWRMPSDASFNLWMSQLENINPDDSSFQ